MTNTIDMQDMRYINLFGQISKVNTRYCFKYNETIIFAVPRMLVSKAIGENGRNVKRLNEILARKIKIVASPEGIRDAKEFFSCVVNPTTFKDLDVTNNEIIITAGPQSKAALIGRNRRRELELQKIAKNYFKRELRII